VSLSHSARIVESDRTFKLRMELADSIERDRIEATYPLCPDTADRPLTDSHARCGSSMPTDDELAQLAGHGCI
jgi:hypothetical protein